MLGILQSDSWATHSFGRKHGENADELDPCMRLLWEIGDPCFRNEPPESCAATATGFHSAQLSGGSLRKQGSPISHSSRMHGSSSSAFSPCLRPKECVAQLSDCRIPSIASEKHFAMAATPSGQHRRKQTRDQPIPRHGLLAFCPFRQTTADARSKR